jgi:hypothetical protein
MRPYAPEQEDPGGLRSGDSNAHAHHYVHENEVGFDHYTNELPDFRVDQHVSRFLCVGEQAIAAEPALALHAYLLHHTGRGNMLHVTIAPDSVGLRLLERKIEYRR